MRTMFSVLVVGTVVAGAMLFGPVLHGAPGHAPTDTAAARVPVLVELFTSEGCSSCPPADRVLATLIAQQPVPGALIIGLSEHVDYWDHQGWRDPYSWSGFTARQQTYAREKFGSDQVYTPQLVVGGREQLIGSDYAAALKSIAQVAAGGSTVDLTVITEAHDRGVAVQITGSTRNDAALDADVDLWLAATEDGLAHPVTRGENAGKQLSHTAVVRTLVNAGRWPRRASHADLRVTLPVGRDWHTDQVHLVAFAQDRSTRGVLGVVGARPALPATR